MILKNCNYYDKDFNLATGDIKIEGNLIKDIGRFRQDGIDCADYIILPGFIDIHTHGCNMADASFEGKDNVLVMSKYLFSKGVTSFCPTTMTLPENALINAFKNIACAKGNEPGAEIIGVNMEGPFISKEKKGAQNEKYILSPDISLFEKLNTICNISLVDIAPESDIDFSFSKTVSKKCTVSMAHTCADYDKASEAFKNGITHTTHLFNAMTPFTSREPGAVGAVFDSDFVSAEMICDLIHIHGATLRTAFKIIGENRTVVVSDSMMAAGLERGIYSLGGQEVIVEKDARLKDGTLAGSVTNLWDEFQNLIKIGVPVKQIIKSLTINPAKVVKADAAIGSIEIGKKAHLLLVSKDFTTLCKVIKGE